MKIEEINMIILKEVDKAINNKEGIYNIKLNINHNNKKINFSQEVKNNDDEIVSIEGINFEID